MYDPATGLKRGGCFDFNQDFLDLVGFTKENLVHRNPIAQSEAVAVVVMMLQCAEVLAGRDVLLLIDNTSALHTFLKGISTNEGLARSVAVAHLLTYHYRCRVW